MPVWGFAERIAYRALVDFLLRDEPPLDRSPEAYLEFIGGPVRYARELEPSAGPFARVGSSVVQYVVKADVNAFYDYIDHGILSRELLSRTGDYRTIECLMSLLGEVQGRAYGLPQLLDSSDQLSELYIDIVEREVLRRGWPAWRFNDDFRIAVRDFGAALAAIEDLAAAARDVGLTLNDVKTTTPKFSRYALENFGLSIDDELPDELGRHDPEDFVGDYIEGVGETDPTWAIQILRDANAPDAPRDSWSENGIMLGEIRGDDIRMLRRALGRLARAGIDDAFGDVVKLVVYVPSLTPWAVRYVMSAGRERPEAAANVLGSLVADVSLSDWQRAWIVHAFDELGLLDPAAPGSPEGAVEWVAGLRHGRHGPVVVAQAALALAHFGRIEFSDLEHALRSEPGAMATWYLVAIRRLHDDEQMAEDQYSAIRGEGGLHGALLATEQ